MIEIVVRTCERAQILTEAGVAEYIARKYGGAAPDDFTVALIPRDDPVLVQMVKERQGDSLVDGCSKPTIIAVPDGSVWRVRGFPSCEWVALDG